MQEINAYSTQVGNHDSVIDGVLIKGLPTLLTFVADKTERNSLTNKAPDLIVLTRDFANIWLWDANGNGSWVTIKES